ncbi:suppressor of glycerol defect [Trapelia coarctata]|nr:suppressor of glycerol defect [Trapelia coarctata]
MRQPTNSNVKLPRKLLSELGIDDGSAGGPRRKWANPAARKERRKATRVQKKARTTRPRIHTQGSDGIQPFLEEEDKSSAYSEDSKASSSVKMDQTPAKIPKSILKKAQPEIRKTTPGSVKVPLQTSDSTPRSLRSMQQKLAADDAEIEALENALGIKGKSRLPKAFEEDGLDSLLTGLDSLGDKDDLQSGKRKRPEEEEWLKSKRRKALGDRSSAPDAISSVEDESGTTQFTDNDDDGELSLVETEGTSEEEVSDMEDFGGFDSEEEYPNSKPVRVRENPYIAPSPATEHASTKKYIPPSLRASMGAESENFGQLRRRIQGLLNRLSEANILGILDGIEKLYQSHPRHHISVTLIDLLMGLLSDPTILQDTFLILHAGFIAGVYKIMGTDFGAQVVQKVVEDFDGIYETKVDGDVSGKKLTNLTSLLAEMYNFQVVGSGLIYDFVRIFLTDLNELNAELLLRIIRISGPQLRQDDPTALRNIVLLLQPAVAKIGAENLSVRTKFMIETMNNLKNNRMKTGVAASAMVSEHTIRMKKTLGSLNTRDIKASEPLRIGLDDIRDTEKRGKWWLVGASYRDKDASQQNNHTEVHSSSQTVRSHEDEERNESNDLLQLAREHRMNTDIRRSIFVTIMSASDYRDAHLKLLKLRLKKAQELEIPKVLIHCAGAESAYNPFYTLIAKLLCADRKLKMAFQFSLWDLFKKMGEGSDEDDEEEEDETLGLRAVVNLARMFGALIAEDSLRIGILKTLNFVYLQPKTRTFVELLLVTVIIHSQHGAPGTRDERSLMDVFLKVKEFPELVEGLKYFLRKVVRKSDIASTKQDKETVKWGCKVIGDTLSASAPEVGGQ